MDLIVSVCRVLANRSCLRLLRIIYAQPGSTVQALATATKQTAAEVSRHLKLLGSFHLVQARPKGRYVHYQPAQPLAASHPFLRDMQALARAMLSAPESNSTPSQVWNFQPAADPEPEDAVLMKLFTTYTHLRRLMILRHLLQRGSASAEHLAVVLKMSAPAIHRHLHKLQRRAVVATTDATPHLWLLARPACFPWRQQLLNVILRTLKPMQGK